ncbi:hypothetical protein DTO021C3_8627 [Paecilomyces variotii]|nr:hypothetical protein DTO021C3_8627 [Paecilomyces variotii]
MIQDYGISPAKRPTRDYSTSGIDRTKSGVLIGGELIAVDTHPQLFTVQVLLTITLYSTVSGKLDISTLAPITRSYIWNFELCNKMAVQSGYAASPLNLYSLPNEVLVSILTPFPTRSLLPLTVVSHRFHALILRILHYRLLVATSLKDYKLMLECFHPSSKLTEPHVFCKYLGTDGLSDKHEGVGSLYENCETAEQLARLGSLYSRFRPEPPMEDDTGRTFLVPPTGRVLELAGAIESLSADNTGEDSPAEPPQLIKRAVHLEEFEDFSQLCTVVNLVKVVPNSSMLLSAVTIQDGTVRVWRDWLKDQSNHKDKLGISSNDPNDTRILWADTNENVGLKLRVREKRWNRFLPVLVHKDEELAVSYELEIEELYIRTTRLLMTLEESLQEEQNCSKAIVFGSYRV